MLGFDPEEFGQSPEETSNPMELADIMSMASQGAAIAAQARQDPAGMRAQQARLAAVSRAQRAASIKTEQPQDSVDPYQAMDEIEYRLGLASYYRALLEQPLFQNDDDFSEVIVAEVRQFIMSRLGELLGTNRPQPRVVEVKPQFSDAEVQALRLLANRLMTVQPTAPVVSKEMPTEPAVEPVRPTAQLLEPKVCAAKTPHKPEVVAVQQPTAPKVVPASHPRVKRRAQPVAPTAPVPEAPQSQVISATTSEPPSLPLPMPRGAAFTAVTANAAAQAVVEMDQTVERTLSRR